MLLGCAGKRGQSVLLFLALGIVAVSFLVFALLFPQRSSVGVAYLPVSEVEEAVEGCIASGVGEAARLMASQGGFVSLADSIVPPLGFSFAGGGSGVAYGLLGGGRCSWWGVREWGISWRGILSRRLQVCGSGDRRVFRGMGV